MCIVGAPALTALLPPKGCQLAPLTLVGLRARLGWGPWPRSSDVHMLLPYFSDLLSHLGPTGGVSSRFVLVTFYELFLTGTRGGSGKMGRL